VRVIEADVRGNVGMFAKTTQSLRRARNHLYDIWDQMQVNRQGAYTSRRARALDRYVYTQSKTRVLAVCILTPIPVLAFVLLQELVPLDAPAAGWSANYRWFVRSAVIFLVLTLSYIQQGVIFLAPLRVSWRQALVLTLGMTGSYFGALVSISSVWVFPVPFAGVVTTGVFTCLFFGIFIAVVGWRTVTTTPELSAHARILMGALLVEAVMVFVYPAFNAAFHMLHGVQQLAFLLVLFLLKLLMRYSMAYALRHSNRGASVDERWRARLPEVVVFSTELFHVLYLTTCLQSQHVTVWATIGISLFDASSSVVSLHQLLKRPKMMLVRRPLSQSRRGSEDRHFHSLRDFVLVARPALSASQSLRVIVPQILTSSRSFRAIAPMPGPTTQAVPVTSTTAGPIVPSTGRRTTIDVSALFSDGRRSSNGSLPTLRRLSLASVSSIKRARRSSSRESSHSSLPVSQSAPQDESNAQRQAQPVFKLTTEEIASEVSRLKTLSKTEYFLLIEYVKLIIPAIYGVFQVVLTRLPNAAFYPSIANATPLDLRRAHINILVFVAMEVLSLTGFMLLLHRRLKFSVLHQLAFVLETAADDIQAKLAMFIPYCFFFFLEHNGAWSDLAAFTDRTRCFNKLGCHAVHCRCRLQFPVRLAAPPSLISVTSLRHRSPVEGPAAIKAGQASHVETGTVQADDDRQKLRGPCV